ncbi:VOC family protein [Chloroflexota bacterium]
MFSGIDHVEIVTSNIERSLNFYSEILGFTIKLRRKAQGPPREEMAFLILGDTIIELFSVKDPLPYTDQWQVGCRRIALQTEDLDKAIEHLKAKGVEIYSGPRTTPTAKVAEIKDPDGLSIELMQGGMARQVI